MAKTVIALYDEQAEAEAALRELIDVGYPRDEISLVAGDSAQAREFTDPHTQPREGEPTNEATRGAGIGAGTGAVVGGIGGLLVGLGLLAIPGIGPLVAAGPIVTTLAGAGVGAAAGGLLGALAGMGVPRDEAESYAEGVRRGGNLVILHTDDRLADRASEIMNRYGAIDIEARSAHWRQQGWSGYDPKATAYSAEEAARERALHRPQRLPETVVAHQATLERPDGVPSRPAPPRPLQPETRPAAGVPQANPIAAAATMPPRSEPLPPASVAPSPVASDVPAASVAAAPVSPLASVPPSAAPIAPSRAVPPSAAPTAPSRAVPPATALMPPEARSIPAGDRPVVQPKAYQEFDHYATEFRRDFETTLSNRGYTYEHHLPAYRYGYLLATDPKYRGRDWAALEEDARTYWEERNPNTWYQFSRAIRYAWQTVRGT